MKKILTLCAAMFSLLCEAQTKLPGQCQVGMPKIINSELIKDKEVKQLFQSSDWGQSDKAERYWVVYSDRENNVTYNKPDELSGRFETLNFNEELRIAKIENGFALVYKEEKPSSIFPKINKGVSRGWVPMTHLLLWNSCPTNDLGIYHKALPVINVDEYLKNKDSNIGKIFKNPIALSNPKNLMAGMDFYLVMKEDSESGMILLSRLCNLVGTTSQVLYGWVSKSSFVPWNQRSCLEPNWNREAAEKFSALPEDKRNVPVYRKTNLTDLACTMPLGRKNNYGKRATEYRMYKDEMRYPLLDNDVKKDEIYKVTAFARPDGKGHVQRIRKENDNTKIKEIEDRMKENRIINLIFVVDGTNSMKDFYGPVQKIIQEANNFFGKQEGNEVKCGAVIYRDYPDGAYCTEHVPMTSPTDPVLTTFLQNGGKYGIKSVAIPETEALYKGLELALDADKMHFSPKNSNMMFVIGDCGNDPEDKNCLSEEELVNKCIATRMQVSAFQVFNGTSQAYKLFRRQLNRLITESLNGQYRTSQVKGLETKWRDLEDGYEFTTNLPDERKFFIGNTRNAPNGEKMDVAKLYDMVKDSYIQFNTAINARVAAILHSDELGMDDDESIGAAAIVNINFLEGVFGKDGLKKLREDNMVTAFEGYTKQKDDELGEDYWKPVIYISEDEFKDLMSNLQGVMTAVSSGSEDRRPYVNAMKTLVRTMIPDITEAQMQQKGNKEIMAMVAGLNVSSDALRGRTLEEIQDNNVVPQAEFQGLISNFMDKFNKLDQIRTSEYEYSIVRNGTRWFWIPVSDLP